MCKLKTVNIKGKEYVEVNERLKAFRTLPEYKGYSLETEIHSLENGVITMKATIKDADGNVKATGYAQEKESSSFINKTSFVENCETSAWGRALRNLGIGIDTSVASAEEVKNAIENQKKPNKNDLFNELTSPIDENPDQDIIQGLMAISDINNLVTYKDEYKDKVIDTEGFKNIYKTKYKELTNGNKKN